MSKKGARKRQMSKRERELWNERRENMKTFWSDRVLPATREGFDLSNLTNGDIGYLELARFILTQTENEGVELIWGYKVEKKSEKETEVNDE